MKKSTSIRIIAFTTIIIGLIIISISAFRTYKSNIIENYKAVIKDHSEDNSLFITEKLNSTENCIESYGDLISTVLGESLNKTSENNISIITNILSSLSKKYDIIDTAYFIDNTSGEIINTSGLVKSDSLPDYRKGTYYSDAKLSTKPVISPIYKDKKSNSERITISYGIRKDNVFKGVLSCELYLYDITNYNVNDFDNTYSASYILSPYGKVLINDSKNSNKILPYINFENFSEIDYGNLDNGYTNLYNEMNRQDSGFMNYKSEYGENVLAFYSVIPGLEYKLVTVLNNNIIKSKERNFITQAAISVLITAILLIILANLIIDKIFSKNFITGFYSKNKLIEDLILNSNSLDYVNILFVNIKNYNDIDYEHGPYVSENFLSQYGILLKKMFKGCGNIYSPYEYTYGILFHSTDNNEIISLINKNKEKLVNTVFVIQNNAVKPKIYLSLIQFSKDNMINSTEVLPKIKKIIQEMDYGESSFMSFSLDELIEKEEKDKETLNILNKAINEDRLVPFFQKVVNIKTGAIEKYEVLMRIQSGDDYLSPYPFIIAAEKNNIIDQVDFIMMKKTMEYKCKIDKEDKLIFSFNISGKLLNSTDYLNKLKTLVDKFERKHENIVFEITETENVDSIKKLSFIVNKFKKENFKFSIDDFGMGYSSIYYLKNINADYLKIDGSFIKDINECEENTYLVKSIINMAKAYKIKTVAEFVEDEKILKSIADLDVDFAQGYYFDKPQPSISLTPKNN